MRKINKYFSLDISLHCFYGLMISLVTLSLFPKCPQLDFFRLVDAFKKLKLSTTQYFFDLWTLLTNYIFPQLKIIYIFAGKIARL